MLWCWYLAVEIQFYIISPLFMVLLQRSSRFGYTLIGVVTFASCLTNFMITNQNNLLDGPARYFQHLKEPLYQDRFFHYIYLVYQMPYTRISPYLIGIALGYYFYTRRKNEDRKNTLMYLCFGWFVTALMMGFCYLGFYNRDESAIESAVYNGLKHLFSCSLAWIMFLCISGQGEGSNFVSERIIVLKNQINKIKMSQSQQPSVYDKTLHDQYDSKVYCSGRKDTAEEVIEIVLSFLKEKIPEPLEKAADVGCGTGQSTAILAPYFKHVYGSDVSVPQIQEAIASRSLPNVTYSAGPAEELPFEDGSLQLVTAATSMHWFKLDLFLPEVRRVLCTNGVLAAFGYLSMQPLFPDPQLTQQADDLFKQYHLELRPYSVVSAFMMLKDRYKDVDFPFEEVNRCPDVRCTFPGRLSEIVEYVMTFSSFQNFKKADAKAAEESIGSFRKRLYEIGAAANCSPEDTVTLFRDYRLVMCRKTKPGPFCKDGN
ncbi:methyltransferase DDB_G0268948 [Caerostris extrusa]|uniref:Methyltransferase DDB_G0268948 n=1 Tax=Caerostris extrusa TaxID=172846 RepID=A0AAV4WUJ1_CAEEX|nr:methyltransferase DDB_G0268948 [Caerostris extrusa]